MRSIIRLPGVIAIVFLLSVNRLAAADDGGDPNVALYQKIVSSTVLIINGPAIGTGVVVDQKQGLIVTDPRGRRRQGQQSGRSLPSATATGN